MNQQARPNHYQAFPRSNTRELQKFSPVRSANLNQNFYGFKPHKFNYGSNKAQGRRAQVVQRDCQEFYPSKKLNQDRLLDPRAPQPMPVHMQSAKLIEASEAVCSELVDINTRPSPASFYPSSYFA